VCQAVLIQKPARETSQQMAAACWGDHVLNMNPSYDIKETLAATLRGSRPGVQAASLYDNF